MASSAASGHPGATAHGSASSEVAPDGGRFVVASGLKIYLKDEGDPRAPVILMLHGGAVTQAAWDPVVPLLAGDYRVVRPDTRAHGRTGDDGGALSYWRFADDALALLRVLGVDRALVVGHSDGGATALAMGLQHPEQLAGLVAVGTPYDLSNYLPGVFEEITTWVPTDEDRLRWQPDLTSEAFASLTRRLLHDMWRREPSFTLEQLSAIMTPSLVLHSEHEEYYSSDASRAMADAMGDATYVEVPDCTHESPEENPAFIAAHVLALAAKVFG